MLVIRKAQMEAFEKIAVRRFEDGLLDHLRTFFPDHTAVLGDQQLVRVIRYGLQRAQSRNVQTERGVYRYLALMFMLGSLFDEDPQLPWAAAQEPVTPPAVNEGETAESAPPPEEIPETPDAQIERVYGEAMAFLDQTAGPDNGHLHQTLNLLRQPQVFDGLPPAPSFGHRLLLLLQALAPAKYQTLGDEPVRALVRSGYEAAKRHGFVTEPGMMNYIALAYVLGSGFDRDPVYPWAAATLSDPALVNPAQRSAVLRETALAYLAKCPPGCSHRAEQSAAVLEKADQPWLRIVEG
ncbi:MAG: hypothetical protein ACOYMW_07395 [Candidatus Competibacteraceae bacterium]